jgi:hypothetical protein
MTTVRLGEACLDFEEGKFLSCFSFKGIGIEQRQPHLNVQVLSNGIDMPIAVSLCPGGWTVEAS